MANYRQGIITYTGNGTSQSLSGLGFTPIAVILKRRNVVGSLNGCCKTTTMGSNVSVPLAAAGTLTTGITSLDADGFSVGNHARANQSGALYSALCFGVGASNSFIRVGTYTGDGTASQAITIATGWKPDYILIIGNTENCWRSVDHVGDEAIVWKNSTKQTGLILSMDTDGFTVGADGATNTNLTVYYYIAWRRAGGAALDAVFNTDTYVGTGANLTVAAGLTPAYVLAAHYIAGFDAYQRFSGYPANTSTGWGTTTDTTSGIRDFSGTDFEAGTFVSRSGATHHFLAIAATANLADPVEIEFSGGDALAGRTVGETWFELTDGASVLQLGSTLPLADPGTYYGGFKEARVKIWARIQRALSDMTGAIEGGTFGFTLEDTDRKWRGILGTAATRALRRRPVVIRSIDDDSRRLQATPRTIARGLVQSYQPRSPFLFDVNCEDAFTQTFTPVQADRRQVPLRRITTTIFDDAPRESWDLPEPIIYGRATDFAGLVGAAQVTGVTALGTAPPAAAPTGVVATAIAGGDSGVGITRYYVVSAITAGRESKLSAVVSATTTAANRQIKIDWDAYAGATAIRLYSSPRPDFLVEAVPTGIGIGAANHPSGELAGGATTYTEVQVPGSGFGNPLFRFTSSLYVVYRVYALLASGAYSNPGGAVLDATTNGDDISTSEVAFSPYMLHPDSIRDVTVSWSALSGAVGYRVYRGIRANFLPDGKFMKFFDVDTSTLSINDSLIFGGDLIGPEVPLPGATSGGAEIATEEVNGVVPAIHVGTELIAGATWQRLLVCGHAVKEVQAVFRTNRGAPEGSLEEVPASEFGSTWHVPGKTGWPFGTDYRDIGGRRYTLIYTTEDPIPVEVLVNVLGIEATGDGTGALLENIFDQYLHFIQNWVLGNYLTGAWLTTPAFPDDATLLQIDETSFATAKTVSEARLPGIRQEVGLGGGYFGAGAFGSEGEFLTIADALARWNVSADCDAGFNAKFQYMVSMFEESPLVGVPVHDDVVDIFDGSFTIEELHDAHANIVPYEFGRDYRLNLFHVRDLDVRDQDSIDAYGQDLPSPLLQLFLIRDPTMAKDIAGRRLLRSKNPPRLVRYTTGLQGLSIELGALLLVSHAQGISATGWLKQPLRITRHEVDPNDFSVTLQGWDVFDLFQEGFILGDEVALGPWVGGTVEDRRYGYLADETTDLFGDGAPIKRLR